jgi:hypothetical protein
MGWSTRRTVTLVIAALMAVAELVAVRCPFGPRLSDHPIVHPGKESTAHSHDCFGNTSTKFHATYESRIAAPTT